MVAGALILAAGAAVAIGGGIASDQKSRKAARRSKREARRQAVLIQEEGLFQAGRLGAQTRRVRASQVAAFGAAGVQQTGTPEEVALETLAQSTLEQSRILKGAGRNRSALLVSANERARALRAQGQSALIGGFSSALGAGAQASTSFQQSQFLQEQGQ